jgi:hypothetical protein
MLLMRMVKAGWIRSIAMPTGPKGSMVVSDLVWSGRWEKNDGPE